MKRSPKNPILSPVGDSWQEEACFNPNVVKDSSKYVMAYRAISGKVDIGGTELNLSTIGRADSQDGLVFDNRQQLIKPEYEWEKYGCEDPRICKMGDNYYIFYTAISNYPPSAEGIKLAVAISSDLKTIKEKHLVTPFNSKAGTLFPEKINGKYAMILTIDTDKPPSQISVAYFSELEEIWSERYWRNWYKEKDKHEINLSRLNTDQVEVGSGPIKTDQGWLLIYAHIQNYYTDKTRIFGIEAVLLDIDNPQKILARTASPFLVPEKEYEKEGQIKNVIFPSGALVEGDNLKVYYGATDTFSAVAETKLSELLKSMKANPVKQVFKLTKYKENPVLETRDHNTWETMAVFNPTVVYEDKKFYLIYRALDKDKVSRLGCAISKDGFDFFTRLEDPIYVPRMDYEQRKNPNNYSGCEDPRITKINDRFYLCYTAYDGFHPPRVALSWIKSKDLIEHNWLWSKPILISPPGVDNKDTCLFPEKINGRYLLLHRGGGKEIALDWLDDLSHFDGVNWLEKEAAILPRPNSWDGEKIGVAGPPIKTPKGWLLLYHGVSDIDHQYRVGMMMLDLNDPAKVLYRSQYPILEPTETFEKEGLVPNVVFPCGMALVDKTLYVHYGGADKVICVATANIDELLNSF
jgi:beta-1,2-mannobiose phosphorylase / 1,2-beta-oligomannan phosphorylase